MSAGMNRREFFSALLGRRHDAPAACPGMALSPEFTPEALRAEAARMGLDVRRMTETEMAEAVLRAMYAQAGGGADGPANPCS